MTARTSRITGLDGLRGIAALIVLLFHTSLLARPFLGDDAWAVLTRTPVKLLFAGSEAVLVFFVLSGLVVALPALRGRLSWWRYYPSRLLRLYLPVAAALLLAAALILLLPRDPAAVPAGSWMRNAQSVTATPGELLSEASLLQASYDIDNVLWSLRWELFFSLLLPVFVWIGLRTRRAALLTAGGAVVLTLIGRVVGIEALVYLPTFLLGVLVAANLDSIRAAAGRPRVRRWLAPAFVTACALLIASWLARPVAAAGSVPSHVLWALSGAGAAGLVVLAVVWAPAVRTLDRAPVQWLGRISFSLYLVHAPLLGTLGYALGRDLWWLACLLGVPLSIALAALFHRLVERPSHRLARVTGEWCAGRADAVGGRLGGLSARARGGADAG